MAKVKKQLSPAQKSARKKARAKNREKFMWIMQGGKQVKVKRPPTIDGIPVDEFVEQNADPIWLHQNGMWELIPSEDDMENEDEDNCSTLPS